MNAFAAYAVANAVLTDPHPSHLPHPASRVARRSLTDRLSDVIGRVGFGSRAARRDGLSGSVAG